MKNIVTIEDVLELRHKAVEQEFPGLSKSAREEILGSRLETDLAKGMVTSGIVPAAGTTGADAAKVEDLSSAIGLQALGIQHTATWKMLPKKATVSDAVEFVTADSVGETVGGGYVDPSVQDGGIAAVDGSLERKMLPIKWYAAQYQTFQNAMAVTSIGFSGRSAPGEADNTNQFMALQRHVRNLNWAALHADNAKNALEPTGLIPQIQGVHSTARPTRFDMNGQPIGPDTWADLGAMIYQASGSFTDLVGGVNVLADFQKQLQPGSRHGLGEKTGLLSYPDATLVQGLGGDPNLAKIHRDLDLDAPLGYDDHAADAGAPSAPTSLTSAVDAGTLNWRGKTGLDAGTYYYSVVAYGNGGRRSIATADTTPAQVVAQGERVTLTITRSDANTKEYRIYRGTSASTRQYLGRVKCTGATDTFVDNNEKIPGTGSALALTIAPMGDGHATIEVRQLFPMTVIDLPRSLMAFNKAYLTGMTPQVRTPYQQVVIENIGRYVV